jgi:hypothetical protein
MKRLAFLLILLLLIPSVSQARPRGIFKTVASGTVTQANMRLSGVDGGATASGGAFVDFGYKYQSDFSAGVDGWTAYQGAVDGNIDGIGGQDNTVRYTCNNTSNPHQLQRTTTYTIGKKYTVTFRYYIPSGNSNVDQIFLIPGNWGGGTTQVLSTLDTWTSVTKTFTASAVVMAFAATDGGVTTFTDPGGDDVFYIKDVKIEENPPTSYIGHLLKITDSAGKSIMGYIKAAMAGESLDTEVATGTLTALKLYKITATEVNHFGTGKVVGSYFTSNGTETCDANNKVQCVLVGAATGVTIVSSKGGATYNWFNKNSAFNWNDTSGYTYQIIKENRTALIATSNITAGNALMDTTTANAFAAPVGVDLTAYQDGRHLAHFTDSSGRVAVGWISATAPSGEALSGVEKLTNGDMETGDPPSNWTPYGSSTLSSVADPRTGSAGSKSMNIVRGTQVTSAYQIISSSTPGALYYYNGWTKNIDATSINVFLQSSVQSVYLNNTSTSWANKTGYITAFTGNVIVNFDIVGANGKQGRTDDNSLQRVDMPAATGALLLSSKGGSRGFLYKHASFNPNAALTMKILYWGD